jgi:hypothetical protein
MLPLEIINQQIRELTELVKEIELQLDELESLKSINSDHPTLIQKRQELQELETQLTCYRCMIFVYDKEKLNQLDSLSKDLLCLKIPAVMSALARSKN